MYKYVKWPQAPDFYQYYRLILAIIDLGAIVVKHL